MRKQSRTRTVHARKKAGLPARRRGSRAKNAPYARGRSRRRRRTAAPAGAVQTPREHVSPSYEEGYRDGLYDGGERWLEAALPGDAIVPDISLAEVLEAGLPRVLGRRIPLLGAEAVCDELIAALDEGRPYSLVRLGDGELLTLSQDKLLPAAEIARQSPFLAYAGVDAPDDAARDVLAAAVREATTVGVPLSRRPNYQPLLFEALRRNGVELSALRLTSSMVNYALHESGQLGRLLAGRRVAIVGNSAEALARALRADGTEVVHTVAPVDGFADFAHAAERAAAVPFDIALVSAGVAAVPICVRLAALTGKVAIDFGHMADRLGGVKVPAVRGGG